MPKIDPPSSALPTAGLWYLSIPTGDNVDADLVLLMLEDLLTPTDVILCSFKRDRDKILLYIKLHYLQIL